MSRHKIVRKQDIHAKLNQKGKKEKKKNVKMKYRKEREMDKQTTNQQISDPIITTTAHVTP